MTLDAWTQTHIYWHSQRIRKSKCADTDPSTDLHLILYRPRNADVTTQTSERTRASFTSRNTFPSSHSTQSCLSVLMAGEGSQHTKNPFVLFS